MIVYQLGARAAPQSTWSMCLGLAAATAVFLQSFRALWPYLLQPARDGVGVAQWLWFLAVLVVGTIGSVLWSRQPWLARSVAVLVVAAAAGMTWFSLPRSMMLTLVCLGSAVVVVSLASSRYAQWSLASVLLGVVWDCGVRWLTATWDPLWQTPGIATLGFVLPAVVMLLATGVAKPTTALDWRDATLLWFPLTLSLIFTNFGLIGAHTQMPHTLLGASALVIAMAGFIGLKWHIPTLRWQLTVSGLATLATAVVAARMSDLVSVVASLFGVVTVVMLVLAGYAQSGKGEPAARDAAKPGGAWSVAIATGSTGILVLAAAISPLALIAFPVLIAVAAWPIRSAPVSSSSTMLPTGQLPIPTLWLPATLIALMALLWPFTNPPQQGGGGDVVMTASQNLGSGVAINPGTATTRSVNLADQFATLAQLDPTVMLLQGVNRGGPAGGFTDQYLWLARHANMSSATENAGAWSDVSIFSVYPLQSPTANSFGMSATAQLPGFLLELASVSLPPGQNQSAARQQQLAELVARQRPARAIVGGTFSTAISDPQFEALVAAGYSDGSKVAVLEGERTNTTYQGSRSAQPQQSDYLLVRGDLEIIGRGIGASLDSSHRPLFILVRYELEESR